MEQFLEQKYFSLLNPKEDIYLAGSCGHPSKESVEGDIYEDDND